jgi:hypothetical protein
MLRRQPSSKDQARKLWEAILGLRYFGPAKSGEREGGLRAGGQQISWHLTARAKKKRLTVMWPTRCKRCQKQRQRGPKTATICPGNERCAVKSRANRPELTNDLAIMYMLES